MKKLILGLLATLLCTAAYADSIAPSDPTGTWTNSTGPDTYVCTETSCTVTLTNFSTTCHAIYGSFSFDGQYVNYVATYVSGTCSYGTSWNGYFSIDPVLSGAGFTTCEMMDRDTSANLWISTVGRSGGCEMPTGEGSGTFKAWVLNSNIFGGANFDAYAQFTAPLVDSNNAGYNFSGRQTNEVITLQTPVGCVPAGVPQMTVDDIKQGGIGWTVDHDNNYSVGWSGLNSYAPDSVGFYTQGGYNYIVSVQRNYAQALPCTITTKQQMLMYTYDGNPNDNPTLVNYGPNQTNTFVIGDGTLKITRNGASSPTASVGLPRAVWRFQDWVVASSNFPF